MPACSFAKPHHPPHISQALRLTGSEPSPDDGTSGQAIQSHGGVAQDSQAADAREASPDPVGNRPYDHGDYDHGEANEPRRGPKQPEWPQASSQAIRQATRPACPSVDMPTGGIASIADARVPNPDTHVPSPDACVPSVGNPDEPGNSCVSNLLELIKGLQALPASQRPHRVEASFKTGTLSVYLTG